MSDPTSLVEYLQATAPRLSTQLTMERLTFVRQITGLQDRLRSADELLGLFEESGLQPSLQRKLDAYKEERDRDE